MKFEFVPVDFDYFDFEGCNYVLMVGRNGSGKKVCVIDSYEPNFWVVLKKGFEKKAEAIAEKIGKLEVEKAGRKTKVLRTEVKEKKFLGKDVVAIRVFVTNHKDAHDIASEIGDMKEIEFRREYDISIVSKYIKEKRIEPLRWYEIDADLAGLEDFGGIVKGLEVENCFVMQKSKLLEGKEDFEPKILAYDIEADNAELGKGSILMVSLFGEGIKKVLTWKDSKEKQNYVEVLEDEGEMIERFVEVVNEYNPDILTGYFSDGFDLPYLKAASQRNKVKLGLGIDGKGPSFTRGRIPSGRISGVVHVDLYRFIDAVFSQYLQSETLSLNEVAGELVGEKKEDFDFARLAHMKDHDWRDMYSYNLQDSNLTYKLARKIWPDVLEFSKIVKEPLFDVTRDRMSSHVENYIIHNLDRFEEIAEKRPMNDEIVERQSKGKYEGAFVFEPKPGLYEELVFFDFTSMYASVIVTYNLSKSTFNGKDFEKEPGFFPVMLQEIIEKRKKYKKELAKNPSGIMRARSNAYKLLANAAYGYQGFFGARYYCREAAAATARFARENILSVIEKIKKAGFEIVYSDTDSIAFLRGKKNKKEVLDFLKELNEKMPGIMELDLEDFYPRGLFVSKRTTDEGAKKKYALVNEKGVLKIRGFETVRRDWCGLTRELQSEVLKRILEDGNEKKALELLKKTVAKLKNREVALEELMIRTQLRRPLNEYRAEGPHVIAAKKMEEQDIPVSVGMLIEYFIGEAPGKGKRVGDRVFLPDEKANYDIDYYLNNQVLPAVENIFDVFGIKVKEIVEGKKQTSLMDF
jgi:DNA polymerase I/DNA polymerase-2